MNVILMRKLSSLVLVVALLLGSASIAYAAEPVKYPEAHEIWNEVPDYLYKAPVASEDNLLLPPEDIKSYAVHCYGPEDAEYTQILFDSWVYLVTDGLAYGRYVYDPYPGYQTEALPSEDRREPNGVPIEDCILNIPVKPCSFAVVSFASLDPKMNRFQCEAPDYLWEAYGTSENYLFEPPDLIQSSLVRYDGPKNADYSQIICDGWVYVVVNNIAYYRYYLDPTHGWPDEQLHGEGRKVPSGMLVEDSLFGKPINPCLLAANKGEVCRVLYPKKQDCPFSMDRIIKAYKLNDCAPTKYPNLVMTTTYNEQEGVIEVIGGDTYRFSVRQLLVQYNIISLRLSIPQVLILGSQLEEIQNKFI